MILAVLSGCKKSHNELPNGVLSKQQMIEIVTDIQKLEAAHKSITISRKEQSKMKDTSYAIVFNKYNTTALEFDSSLRVWTRYPEEFATIMEQVNKNLNKE